MKIDAGSTRKAHLVNVYISADMEGVAGVATLDQIVPGGHGYPRAQQLMTEEVNAAVAGAFDAGAAAVLVNDSHGTQDNLLQVDLDPRCRLLLGAPKLHGMSAGLTPAHDVALYVGYHAAAGEAGVLAHTNSGLLGEVRLNGSVVSEAEINALLAGSLGVPVGLVTGDDVICLRAQCALPGVRTVEVKRACGFTAADSLSPTRARAAIRQAAADAVRESAQLRPPVMPDRLRLSIDLLSTTAAELMALIPGVHRAAPRTVERDLDSPAEVVGLITVCIRLAAAAQRPGSGTR